jgi:hypothetical protein
VTGVLEIAATTGSATMRCCSASGGIAACRIAQSQSHPLRLPGHTGGRSVIGETPEWMLWVLVSLLIFIMCLTLAACRRFLGVIASAES